LGVAGLTVDSCLTDSFLKFLDVNEESKFQGW
jgi:hypothetical protein